MKKQTIRIGVVGTRNIGKSHIRNVIGTEGAELVAIADTDPARLNETGSKFGVSHRFTCADDLYACNDVDAVVIATPNHLHAPMTIAALEAGCHVLVEKPIARNVAEADAMIAARDRNNKVLMVGMNQRFFPRNTALKNAIAEGKIGSLQYGQTGWTQCRPHDGLWGRGDWFLSKENAGGGPLLDLGVHRLDLALYLLGFPKIHSVSGQCFTGIGIQAAKAKGKEYGIEDGALGLIRFADGSSLTLEASYFQNTPDPRQFTCLFGDRGSLDLSRENPLCSYESGSAESVPVEPDATSATNCVENFVRFLREEETLIPNAEQGRESLRVIEAIYQSSSTGQPVFF